MSTFYFGGLEKEATVRALGLAAERLDNNNIAGMVSRLQYSDNLLEACNHYRLPLVMDCGSFTQPLNDQDIQTYAALILKLGDRFEWYAAPDKIGDQEQSNRNYAYLLSLLPEHLHSRILWIYQVSSDINYLLDGLKLHKRIGIGGLVPLVKADREAVKPLLYQLARILKKANVLPHFFGVSVVSIIKLLHSILPDFTIDSTTWLVAAKYGTLVNKRGQQQSAKELGFNFSTEAMLEQNVRTMYEWIVCSAVDQYKSSLYMQMSMFEEHQLTA